MPETECTFVRGGAGGSVTIEVPSAMIRRFFTLFGRGLCMDAAIGVSIRQFLVDQLCLSGDYVEDRIQTIFLDGRAVDDIDRAMIRPGCVLALSGAMPGLVGATMRRGGRYAILRRDISHDACRETAKQGGAMIRVKLFNLLTREMGPDMLARGGWLEAQRFIELMAGLEEEIVLNGGQIVSDGEIQEGGAVFLRVRTT